MEHCISELSYDDIRPGILNFRAVEVSRTPLGGNRYHREYKGENYFVIPALGTITDKDWLTIALKVIEAHGDMELLEAIKKRVRRLAWMRNEKEENILLYSTERLVNGTWKHWGKKENWKLTFKYIVFDTETTGLRPGWDEVLQLSIIDQHENVLFNRYFKPKAESWERAMQIHGITPEMVQNERPILEYQDEIEQIFREANLLVGYNIFYDLKMLRGEGIYIPDEKDLSDVMEDFAEVYGEWSDSRSSYRWQKLTTAADFYNYDWSSHSSSAHNSLADCYATQFVYEKMRAGN